MSGRLPDWISLGVLAGSVPRDVVDEAVEVTGKGAKRSDGKLPPHVMRPMAAANTMPGQLSSGGSIPVSQASSLSRMNIESLATRSTGQG